MSNNFASINRTVVPLLVGLSTLTATVASRAETATFRRGDPDPIVGGIYDGVEDAHIVQNNDFAGERDQNFGARSEFRAGQSPNAATGGYWPRRTLIRYKLDSLAGGYERINSVTLRLKIRAIYGTKAGELNAYRLADANAGWVEGTGSTAVGGEAPDTGETTYNQRIQGSQNWAGSVGAGTPGTDYLEAALATVNFDSTASGYFDLVLDPSAVGTLIDDWTTGINAGLFLNTTDEDDDEIAFHSSEAAAIEDRPQLIIDYTPAGSPPPNDLVSYRRGAPDPFLDSSTYDGVEDAMILQNNDFAGERDQNYGARYDFGVGDSPNSALRGFWPRRTLVRYDLSSLAGEYERINSVTLRLKISAVRGMNEGELKVHRLADANAGWVEGTGTGAGPGALPDNGETTFDQRIQGSDDWIGSPGAGTAGTDYFETPLTSFTFDSTASGYLDLVLDPSEVGALIDDWTVGTNAGLFLITAAEDNDEIGFHSSEAATLEDRPELIIDFVPKTPPLDITRTASGVRLSWVGGGTRWTLKSSADLETWEPIAEIPTSDSGGFHVDLPADMPPQFFRLENK